MSKNGSLSTFILGGLVGAALGVLFAPRPGYETREILVDRALDYWDNADEYYADVSDRAVEIYATSRDVAMDATEQVRAKIEVARARLLEEVDGIGEKSLIDKEALVAKVDAAEVAGKAALGKAEIAGKAALGKAEVGIDRAKEAGVKTIDKAEAIERAAARRVVAARSALDKDADEVEKKVAEEKKEVAKVVEKAPAKAPAKKAPAKKPAAKPAS